MRQDNTLDGERNIVLVELSRTKRQLGDTSEVHVAFKA